MRQLHAERNRDPENLRLAFRFEQLNDGDRHSVLETAIFGDDANLLIARVLSLAADFHPWRVHQLRLVSGLLLRLRRLQRLRGLRRLRLRRRLWRRLGLLGCCAEAVFANSVAAKVMTMVAVNARPHGRTDTVR